MEFINTGLDEVLSKAIQNKNSYTEKIVEVHRKDGVTYTRKQKVKVGDIANTKSKGLKEPDRKKVYSVSMNGKNKLVHSVYRSAPNKYSYIEQGKKMPHTMSSEVWKTAKETSYTPTRETEVTTPKSRFDIQHMISQGKTQEDIIKLAKNNNVKWKESQHKGVNWMLCCRALIAHNKKNDKQ